MSLTQVDIDDEALSEAMRRMGTKTKKETINRALEEYNAQTKRLEAFRRLAERAERGDFDAAEKAHRDAKAARSAAFAEVETAT